MPYRICKTFDIENGHMLSKHPDKCRFPHGHSRKIECVLEADDLDGREMVCDFKVLKETMDEFLKSWDHAICMNTRDASFKMMKGTFGDRVIAFDNLDPTTEVMARTIYDVLRKNLADYAARADARYPIGSQLRVVKVRLWEMSLSWAEHYEVPPAIAA